MAADPLIPILGAIRRTRPRRVIDKESIDKWPKQLYNAEWPLEHHIRHLHVWIDKFTEGRFYLDPKMVAFESTKDFTIFKLWYENKTNEIV